MTIIDVAKRNKHVMVVTNGDQDLVNILIANEDNRNIRAALSLEEARQLLDTLQKHIECAAVGHDALPENRYDPFTGATQMYVCRRCGDAW